MKLKTAALATFLLASLGFNRPAAAQNTPVEWVDIEIGQSYVHRESRDIARILVSDESICELKGLRPGQFQVRGLEVGSTDLWVWYASDPDNPVSYQITVHRDLSDLIRRIDQIVPEAPPRVYPLDERLVVEGEVPDVETLERVASVARIYDEDFVNLMTVGGDHQVQISVIFAEVSRTGMRELGFNAAVFTPDGLFGMLTPGGSMSIEPFRNAPNAALVSSDTRSITGSSSDRTSIAQTAMASNWYSLSTGVFSFMGMGSIGVDKILLGMLSALEQNSLTKVLAQPTLVALSGQQAEFLAGGEVPLPIVLQDSVGFEYKDYGIKLVFVPTVLAGDVIDLRIMTEVSEVDNSIDLQLGSVAVPGFLTRKGSSHLRIGDGMTFAMAGLLSETVRYSKASVPLLGEIPVVGTLFRYTTHAREERELMIFVTPRLVRPLAPEDVPLAPGMTEDNNPNDFELFLMGLDHRSGSRSAEPTGPIGLER